MQKQQENRSIEILGEKRWYINVSERSGAAVRTGAFCQTPTQWMMAKSVWQLKPGVSDFTMFAPQYHTSKKKVVGFHGQIW
jgi:hypothetical protein